MPSQTRKITLDTAALLFGKAVGLMLGIVRLNFLATYLGVANFGILNFANYFCSLFLVLFDLGTTQLLTRELARDLSRTREYVGKVILLKILMVFIAGVLVGLTSVVSHFESVTNWAILMTTAVFALNGVSMVFLSAFQAHRRMLMVSAANVLNDLILSLFIILLIGSYPYIMTVLILSVVAAFINLLILFVAYLRAVGSPEFRVDRDLWKTFLSQSTPIAISSLGISTYTFIGSTILKYSRGNIESGVFAAGYKLISILTLIPTAFTQVVYPVFSDFHANARAKVEKALQDSLRVMAEISIPLAVGTVILAPKIVMLLYPSGFADAARVLQIIICGEAPVYLAWIMYSFLLALEHQKKCMMISIAVGVTSFLLNLVIVPRFGYIGVAYVMMATDLILFGLYLTYVLRIGFSVGAVSQYAKIVIAAAGMGLALVLLKEVNIVFLIVLGVGIHFGILFSLKGLGDQEKEFLSKAFTKVADYAAH